MTDTNGIHHKVTKLGHKNEIRAPKNQKNDLSRPLEGVTAFLLAGGRGKRLLPLTADRPKPLLPLAGEPLLCRLLRQLGELGCKDAVITAGYLADTLQEGVETYFRQHGAPPAMQIRYFVEKTPLGTAGGVKAAYESLLSPTKEGNTAESENSFLILGGDAFLESADELAKALLLHQERDAAMTVLLSRSAAPTEFGLATIEEDGRLTAFREKPSWAQVDGDLVSTGIYFVNASVFEKIPSGKYDFGYDLLHRLLTDEELLCGYPLRSAWCDVGTPSAYLRCTMEVTHGESYFQGAAAAEGAQLRSSLLFPGVRIADGASVEESILDEGCILEEGAKLESGCVLGKGCRIGKGIVLSAGSVLPGGSILQKGSSAPSIQKNEVPSTEEETRGIPDGLFGDNCLFLSPEKNSADPGFCRRLGRALAAAVEDFCSTVYKDPRNLRIAAGSDEAAAPLREMLLRGIMEGGKEACSLGEVTAGAAAYLARRARLSLTVYLHYDRGGCFRALLFDENRLYPGVPLERPLREALTGELPIAALPGERKGLRAGMRLYTEQLTSLLPPLDGRKITVIGEERSPLVAALRLRGAAVREEDSYSCADLRPKDAGDRLILRLEDSGRKLTVLDKEKMLTPWQVISLCTGNAMRSGAGVISLPDQAPEALKTMVRRGGRLRCFSHTCSDARESAARNLAGEEDYLTDGAFAAARLLSMMHEASLSLREAAALLPSFHFTEEETEVEEEKKASLLAAFAAGNKTKGLRLLPSFDGVLLAGENGAFVRAVASSGRRLCLMAEAGDDADAARLMKQAKAFFAGKKKK